MTNESIEQFPNGKTPISSFENCRSQKIQQPTLNPAKDYPFDGTDVVKVEDGTYAFLFCLI